MPFNYIYNISVAFNFFIIIWLYLLSDLICLFFCLSENFSKKTRWILKFILSVGLNNRLITPFIKIKIESFDKRWLASIKNIIFKSCGGNFKNVSRSNRAASLKIFRLISNFFSGLFLNTEFSITYNVFKKRD